MLWFAAVAFCSSALNNVFVTYMFSSSLRAQCAAPGQARPASLSSNAALTPAWFLTAQGAYALWNAVNDPLAGWLSDTVLCLGRSSGGGGAGGAPTALHRRAWVVRWGGLCWCLFFALAWFPPSAAWGAALAPSLPWLPACVTGLHFLGCLCLYDAALTLVEVNHAALLTDVQPLAVLAPSSEAAAGAGVAQPLQPAEPVNRQRVRANTWTACAMAVGAVTSLPAHWAWEADCHSSSSSSSSSSAGLDGGLHAAWWWPGYFRAFALATAGACGVLFWCAADGLLEEQEEWGSGSGGGLGVGWGACSCSGRRGRAFSRKGSTAGTSFSVGSGGSGSGSGSGAWGAAEEGDAHGSALRHRAAASALPPRSPSRGLKGEGESQHAAAGPAAAAAGDGSGGSGSSAASALKRAPSPISPRPLLILIGEEAARGGGGGDGGAAAGSAPPPGHPALAPAPGTPTSAAAAAAAALFFSSQAAPPSLSSPPSAGFVKRAGTPSQLQRALAPTGKGSSGSLYAADALAVAAAGAPRRPSYRAFLRQLLALPSLRAYVAVATLQAFDCSFGKSFYTLFLAALWSEAFAGQGGGAAGAAAASSARLAGGAQAALVCASFLLPHALTLALEPVVLALGARGLLRGVVALRAALAGGAAVGVAAWAWGGGGGAAPAHALLAPAPPSGPAPLFLAAIAFQQLSRVTSETVCRNLALLKASVVDDYRRWQAGQGQGQGQGQGEGEGEGRARPGGAPLGQRAAEEGGAAGEGEGGLAERDRPAALIGAADFFPRVAASAAPALGYLLLQWGGVGGGGGGGGGGGAAAQLGLPSASLLLLALVAVPGGVSAAQCVLLRGA